MKIPILFTALILTLSHSASWAQDEEKTPAPPEKEANNEQQTGTEEADAAPKRPERLPSSLKRERAPDSEDGSMKILAKHLPKDALVWLDSAYGPFLSIWQKDRSGDPKGALLIIHAEGEHPAWPNTTKPLHDTLPDYGWATLAISLPTPDKKAIPKRTLPAKVRKKAPADSSEAESDEQEKTKAIAEGEEKSTAPEKKVNPPNETKRSGPSAEEVSLRRLESALQFLHEQGQFNLIILGSGYGAIRAHDFLEKITPKIDNPKLKAKVEKPMRAMIIVNGRNQLPTMDDAFSGWFNDPEIPVLDIYEQGDYRNAAEAKARKILAKQKKVAVYKQVKLISLSPQKSWDENSLSRRIRSFLDTNAIGIEVKNAKVRRYK